MIIWEPVYGFPKEVRTDNHSPLPIGKISLDLLYNEHGSISKERNFMPKAVYTFGAIYNYIQCYTFTANYY